MKISANFATYSKRKHTIDKAVESIAGQVDEVRVHYNDYLPEKRYWQQFVGGDFTDRSKFIHIQPNEIAFTCDDDIKYPVDYVQVTLDKLEQYGGIVTYHGRKLIGTGVNYYHAHETMHFRWQDGQEDTKVDVPGTGVMAFNTNNFKPNVLDKNKMVDLLIGLEAVRQDVPITCVRHDTKWIEPIRTEDTIYREFRNGSPIQDKLADKIYNIKNDYSLT